MEKFGVEIDSHKQGLLIEESRLMTQINNFMASPEKMASEEATYYATQSRLSDVRCKINELDGQGLTKNK